VAQNPNHPFLFITFFFGCRWKGLKLGRQGAREEGRRNISKEETTKNLKNKKV